MRSILFISMAFMTVVACGEPSGIRQVGYFKGGSARIFTYAIAPGIQANAVLTHAQSLPYDPTGMMAAYYYAEGSNIPADGVTLASSVFQVNDVLYDMPGLSKWRFAFMRNLGEGGRFEFANCETAPNNDLCRK